MSAPACGESAYGNIIAEVRLKKAAAGHFVTAADISRSAAGGYSREKPIECRVRKADREIPS